MEIDIYRQQDGFYVGKLLKSGKMAKGSLRLSEDDIVTMFTEVLKKHCEKIGQDKFLLQDSDGAMYAAIKLKTEKG